MTDNRVAQVGRLVEEAGRVVQDVGRALVQHATTDHPVDPEYVAELLTALEGGVSAIRSAVRRES